MSKIVGKRGFVTIATGKDWYSFLAENLLLSYRKFASVGYPFALITDGENEFTRQFDHIIHINDPVYSYNDKFILFRELPFEETIYIDSDSLAYGDLDAWWDQFQIAGDFSLFGTKFTDLDNPKGYLIPGALGEYENQVTFNLGFNAGVFYMRNTDACGRVFSIATDVLKNWEKYQFHGCFKDISDEPAFALGMAVCGFEPVAYDGQYIFSPHRVRLKADISIPQVTYLHKNGSVYSPAMIHFSTFRTRLPFYRREADKLRGTSEKGFRNLAKQSGYMADGVKAFVKHGIRHIKRSYFG